MKMQEIREIAKPLGVRPGKLSKTDLIRAIQKAEGNNDCFGRGSAQECGQPACLWREDCLK